MLDYLDKSISELNTQITPNEIAPLSACLKKLREESSQSDDSDSDSLIAATGLAFTLTIDVRNQLNTNNTSTKDDLTNMEKALYQRNIRLGQHYSNKLISLNKTNIKVTKPFEKGRFAAGLALFIFGAALAVTSACSIAATFGVSAPIVLALAKCSLDSFILAAVYLGVESVLPCFNKTRPDREIEMAVVPVSVIGGGAVGAVTSMTPALPSAITAHSITGASVIATDINIIAASFISLTVSAATSLCAMAKGGYLMWSSQKTTTHLYKESCKLANSVLKPSRK